MSDLAEQTAQIPLWLDCEKWLALDPFQRWNGIQALSFMAGIKTRHNWMAPARGIPDKPPSWVIPLYWNIDTKDDDAAEQIEARKEEVLALEDRALFDVALHTRAQHNRAQAIKSCVHEFVGAPGVKTEACVKCGTVRNVGEQPKTAPRFSDRKPAT